MHKLSVIYVLLSDWDTLQVIDSFLDSVMSVCLTKYEIIGGSVDGTVRTFDIRIGRYVHVSFKMLMTLHFVFFFSSPTCEM